MAPPAGRPDFDQALKHLIQHAPNAFLALVAPGLTWRGERSPELPAVTRIADLVWEVEGRNGWRGLLHIELQIKVHANIGERVAEYAIRLWRRDGLAVRTIVVFLRPHRNVPGSPFMIHWMDEMILRYDFTVIKLWEIPAARVLDTPHVDLWPLAGLMANMTAARAMAAGGRIVAAPLPKSEKSELTGLLVLLAGLRFSQASISAALRRHPMIKDLAQESSVAGMWLDEGRVEGMRRAVQRALQGRFGTLDPDVVASIQQADEAPLDTVLLHIGTDTLDQVRDRLGLN